MTVITESNILELTTTTKRCDKNTSPSQAATLDTIETVVIEETITLQIPAAIPTASLSELLEWLKLKPEVSVPPRQKAGQGGEVIFEVSSDVQP